MFLEKLCDEIIEDEEKRDLTPSTTDENDDDDQYYGKHLPKLATANDNTNNSVIIFKSSFKLTIFFSIRLFKMMTG